MQSTLKGVGVALVTPFDDQQQVDYEALGRLLSHTADHVDYYVIHGTTGESVTTTAEEKARIVEFIRENNPKKLPLVYGLGGNNTHHIIEELSRIDLTGFSAILSVSPYYNKPSQEGLYQHYIAIADRSPLPIILYNVPGRTASNLTVQTTLRLAKHRNIIGIKEASGDIMQCMKIAKDKPEDFLLISGDDLLTVPMISFGAVGVISVMANVFPEQFCGMVDSALNGDYDNASRFLNELLDVNDLMYVEGNPVGVKQAMEIAGICGATVRLPLIKASEGLRKSIEEKSRKLIRKTINV